MCDWSAKKNPLPDKTDNFKMKEFFKAKYIDKKFAGAADSDSDDNRAKKKKTKKSKKKKARTPSSSEESSDEKPAKTS